MDDSNENPERLNSGPDYGSPSDAGAQPASQAAPPPSTADPGTPSAEDQATTAMTQDAELREDPLSTQLPPHPEVPPLYSPEQPPVTPSSASNETTNIPAVTMEIAQSRFPIAVRVLIGLFIVLVIVLIIVAIAR